VSTRLPTAQLRSHLGRAAEFGQTLLTHRGPPPGGLILAYHDVVADEAGHNKWVVGVDRLRGHVETLRRLGYRIVHLTEIVDAVIAGRSPDRMAALTFDDALEGVYRFGAPTLAELGAPATVFVVSNAWSSAPAWWPGSAPVMTLEELQEMTALGWSVGAHSRTHPSLPSLAGPILAGEVAGAVEELQRLGFAPVDTFAYPFGHYNASVIEAVSASSCRAACSFLNGRVSAADDRFQLPRLTMGVHVSNQRLAYHALRSSASWPAHQVGESLGGGDEPG